VAAALCAVGPKLFVSVPAWSLVISAV